MYFLHLFASAASLLLTICVEAQSNNGQYTWTTSTTDTWWTPTTTTTTWDLVTTTTQDLPETTYDWTSYTTVTSCYTQNGVTITITTWVPCPCDSYTTEPDTTEPITTEPITTEAYPIGTTTETIVTTTTPAYSTFTSDGIVYVVPLSTAAATATAGADIVVSSSDAVKSADTEGWVGILSAVVFGGFAVIAVVL